MRMGIDIGGMTIKLGLVNDAYEIVGRSVIETKAEERTPQEIVTNLTEAIRTLLKEHNKKLSECESIGIAMPGTSDTRTGTVLYSNNISWKNVPLLSMMQKEIPVPMALANDADAAALGEVLCGAARGYANAVLLTLGTGVGGGVILDKKIFAGPLRGGCELGHMVIKRDGKKCTCGRRGCLEAYASATALMEQARQAVKENPDSKMLELCENNPANLSGKLIFEAQKAGDCTAQKVVENYEEDLSIGIANLVNIFRPEIFILGGGVSAQKEYLTEALQKKVEPMCFGGSMGEVPRIVTSRLGNDAGIIGAAYLTYAD